MADSPIRDEIATTLDGRDITRGWVSPLMLQPPDDSVLTQRGAGDYSLYREVLRDDHVKAALTQRIQAVIARPWEVKPGGPRAIDKQAAEFLSEQLNRLRWDDITTQMLYGVFYGHAVAEVLWGSDGRRVTIEAIKVRDRRRFGYDGAGRLRLKTAKNPQGELLPERKFWSFATGADHHDAPYGLGLAHWLYWPVWLKRNGVKFWATFLEKFGTPTAVGQFPPGTPAEDQAKLLEALQAIQRDAAIIFPEGMQASLLEATRAGTADHAGFTQAMNEAILLVILGQTATTVGTPGKLGGEGERMSVREDITKADADLVCMSFNASVAAWLTEYNFPGAAAPQVWRVMEQPEDLNLSAERDERLARIGYRPTLERVTEVYGEGYETAMPDSAVATPDGAPQPDAAFAEGDAFPDQDALDAALAGLGEGVFTAQAGRAILPALAMIRQARDPAEALGRLAEVYPAMDTDALETLLTRLLFAAQVWGALSADEEMGRA